MKQGYEQYLKTRHWKQLRTRKNKKNCAICASTNLIDVHHLNYKNLFDVTTADLIKLCRRCHFIAHDLMKTGVLKFNNSNQMSRYTLLKTAVKKHLGISGRNMFADA